jgi:hypothetical protein
MKLWHLKKKKIYYSPLHVNLYVHQCKKSDNTENKNNISCPEISFMSKVLIFLPLFTMEFLGVSDYIGTMEEIYLESRNVTALILRIYGITSWYAL